MNRHRLARSMGFAGWQELLSAAKRARELEQELTKEKRGHAGLIARAERADASEAFLRTERAAIAAKWRAMADRYDKEAKRHDEESDWYRLRATLYRETATSIEEGREG